MYFLIYVICLQTLFTVGADKIDFMNLLKLTLSTIVVTYESLKLDGIHSTVSDFPIPHGRNTTGNIRWNNFDMKRMDCDIKSTCQILKKEKCTLLTHMSKYCTYPDVFKKFYNSCHWGMFSIFMSLLILKMKNQNSARF